MARHKLGEIYGELRLKNKQWKENLNKSFKMTKVTSQQMMKAFGVVTLAIGAMGMALTKIVKDIMRYGLEIDKMAKVTGLTTTEVQKLRYAAEQEHASMQALEKGIMNLNVRLGYAGDEMASYTRYFNALGIAYRREDGTLRSAYDVFGDLADVMHRGNLTTEETAAAMQLLGARAAKELIPMLKKGKEWFQKMGDEVDRLGGILDADTIRLIKETDDELTALKTSLRGFKAEIAVEVIPIMKTAISTWIKWNKELRASYLTIDEITKKIVYGKYAKEVAELNARTKEYEEELRKLTESGVTSGKEFDYLNDTIRIHKERVQELLGQAKELNFEQERAGTVVIPKVIIETEKLKKEEEMLSGAFLGIGQDLHEMDHAYLDIIEETKDWSEQTRALGAVLGRVLKQGKMDISSLLQIAISFIPGGGFFKGFLGGLFGEGGVAVPKKWQPIFAAEGMAVAEKPTVSPGGNIYGERGWEVFMKGDQFKEILKPPTIIIHNANPETYVEIIRNSSESDKYKFGRFLEDDVLNKQRYLNR